MLREKTEITYYPAQILWLLMCSELELRIKKKKLIIIMKEKKTNPELQEAILDALNSIQVNRDPVHNMYNNHEFGKGLSLGWIMHTQRSAG